MISCDRCANTTNSEFCVLLSFGVIRLSNFISVFVLKLLIEKGNSVFIQWYSIKLLFSFFIQKKNLLQILLDLDSLTQLSPFRESCCYTNASTDCNVKPIFLDPYQEQVFSFYCFQSMKGDIIFKATSTVYFVCPSDSPSMFYRSQFVERVSLKSF